MTPAIPLDASRFLETLSDRPARAYFANLQKLLVAVAMGDMVARREAREAMAKTLAETMGIAEVVGASLILKQAAETYLAINREAFARDEAALIVFSQTPTQTLIPRVTLQEALDDMVARVPETISNAAHRTAARIAELYSADHVVAFVNAAEAAVTERVKSLIAEAIKEGIPEAESGRLIQMGVKEVAKRTEAWTASYARMAFRTNVNTAVTAGRFRQVQDPTIRRVIPAFRYDAVRDSNTRKNHKAADGLVMKVDNADWAKIAPPLGYNCRCQVSFVSAPDLRRMGRVNAAGDIREDRIPPGAHPDPGFRHEGRPDLAGLRRGV